jgi:hypothetical protein
VPVRGDPGEVGHQVVLRVRAPAENWDRFLYSTVEEKSIPIN